ncbi:hypothetical protein WJX81_006205 [Elliptochloris bilobata]|uniref:Uncharacterized protein n=1 Tax=Elliptochloris bilobata TaxID=381761 RepID=A0AAW1RZS8_9CHLO
MHLGAVFCPGELGSWSQCDLSLQPWRRTEPACALAARRWSRWCASALRACLPTSAATQTLAPPSPPSPASPPPPVLVPALVPPPPPPPTVCGY